MYSMNENLIISAVIAGSGVAFAVVFIAGM
jgi:hypothetical protein